jgi:hypothetical protein
MTLKSILWYICSWRHGSFHVYPLISGLVPGVLGVLVNLYCCSSYGVANTFNSLGTFSSSFTGDPVLSPMDGCEHPLLYLSGTKMPNSILLEIFMKFCFLETSLAVVIQTAIDFLPEVLRNKCLQSNKLKVWTVAGTWLWDHSAIFSEDQRKRQLK